MIKHFQMSCEVFVVMCIELLRKCGEIVEYHRSYTIIYNLEHNTSRCRIVSCKAQIYLPSLTLQPVCFHPPSTSHLLPSHHLCQSSKRSSDHVVAGPR